MFNQLTALGLGLVVFALIIGVGTIVLQQFGNAKIYDGALIEMSIETPEFRLKPLQGQDRSVKHLNYARETDKGFLTLASAGERIIYSPNLRYN